MRLPAMGDTERVILSGLGGAFMAGGIAWISAIEACWAARFLPAAALFAIGAALFVWAFLSRPNPIRDLLDRLIVDGEAIKRLEDHGVRGHAFSEWEQDTLTRIREQIGFEAEIEFGGAVGEASDMDALLTAEIAALKELRKRY